MHIFVNLLMSNLSYDLHQKLKKQAKLHDKKRKGQQFIQYGQMNENNGRRIQSETDYSPDYLPASKYSSPYLRQKRFVEQSVFLPAIQRKQKNHERRHSQSNPYYNIRKPIYESPPYNQYQDNVNTIDTELETMQYLNECQRIIQNLKKLTNISRRKPFNPKSYKASRDQRELRHQPFGYEQRNDQIQRQPSFFGSIEDSNQFSNEIINIPRKGKQSKNPNAKRNQRRPPSFIQQQQTIQNDSGHNKYPANKKQQSFTGRIKKNNLGSDLSSYEDQEEQIINKGKRQANKKSNRKSTAEASNQFDEIAEQNEEIEHISEEQKQQQRESKPKENKKSNLSKPTNSNHEKVQSKIKEQKAIKQQKRQPKQEKPKDKKMRIKVEQKAENNENDQNNSQSAIKNEDGEQSSHKKQQQSVKASKRQKILMKFLNKAKDRGCNLHNRIAEYKLKRNGSQSMGGSKITKLEPESRYQQRQQQKQQNPEKNEQKAEEKPESKPEMEPKKQTDQQLKLIHASLKQQQQN